MNLKDWGARVANWKKQGSAQKPLEWHLLHLHSEVTEVFEALREIQSAPGAVQDALDGHNAFAVVWDGEKDGHHHPEGFGIELADVILVALYIAEVTGVDIEKMMEIKMKSNELKRAR